MHIPTAKENLAPKNHRYFYEGFSCRGKKLAVIQVEAGKFEAIMRYRVVVNRERRLKH